MNIIDPLDDTNNLGRSVNVSNRMRIRNCFVRGWQQMSDILQGIGGLSAFGSPAQAMGIAEAAGGVEPREAQRAAPPSSFQLRQHTTVRRARQLVPDDAVGRPAVVQQLEQLFRHTLRLYGGDRAWRPDLPGAALTRSLSAALTLPPPPPMLPAGAFLPTAAAVRRPEGALGAPSAYPAPVQVVSSAAAAAAVAMAVRAPHAPVASPVVVLPPGASAFLPVAAPPLQPNRGAVARAAAAAAVERILSGAHSSPFAGPAAAAAAAAPIPIALPPPLSLPPVLDADLTSLNAQLRRVSQMSMHHAVAAMADKRHRAHPRGGHGQSTTRAHMQVRRVEPQALHARPAVPQES